VHGWNVSAVDEWIVALGVSNLRALVEIDLEELRFVPEVSAYCALERFATVILITSECRKIVRLSSLPFLPRVS
jgi:hypothetical protein